MYQAINPLKDYGYPSDYGLPMAFNGHSITSNPLSEFDEELEIASYNAGNSGGGKHQQHQQQQPQPQHLPKNNLSSGSSTLSPPRGGQGGQLSSTSGIGDLSTASGKENKQTRTHKKILEKV